MLKHYLPFVANIVLLFHSCQHFLSFFDWCGQVGHLDGANAGKTLLCMITSHHSEDAMHGGISAVGQHHHP